MRVSAEAVVNVWARPQFARVVAFFGIVSARVPMCCYVNILFCSNAQWNDGKGVVITVGSANSVVGDGRAVHRRTLHCRQCHATTRHTKACTKGRCRILCVWYVHAASLIGRFFPGNARALQVISLCFCVCPPAPAAVLTFLAMVIYMSALTLPDGGHHWDVGVAMVILSWTLWYPLASAAMYLVLGSKRYMSEEQLAKGGDIKYCQWMHVVRDQYGELSPQAVAAHV